MRPARPGAWVEHEVENIAKVGKGGNRPWNDRERELLVDVPFRDALPPTLTFPFRRDPPLPGRTTRTVSRTSHQPNGARVMVTDKRMPSSSRTPPNPDKSIRSGKVCFCGIVR